MNREKQAPKIQNSGSKKAAEELAKKLGVSLEAAKPPASDMHAESKGWMARPMPKAAPMMAWLKQQLGQFWPGALENLKGGRGHVVDLSTMIAIGSPPLDQWERGKIEKREGFTIMRVRPKSQPAAPDLRHNS